MKVSTYKRVAAQVGGHKCLRGMHASLPAERNCSLAIIQNAVSLNSTLMVQRLNRLTALLLFSVFGKCNVNGLCDHVTGFGFCHRV